MLITGANRGIGLEFVKQFLQKRDPEFQVIATCRNPDRAGDLQALASVHSALHVVALEMTDLASFDAFATKVHTILSEFGPDMGLDVLINNAGIMIKQTLDELTEEAMLEAFKVNTMAPIFLTRALLPLLKRAMPRSQPGSEFFAADKARVIMLSSLIASMADNRSGNMYPHRCSKAALNMAMVNMSIDLESHGIIVMSINPGWVKTEMGGPGGLIEPRESVAMMIETIDQLKPKDSGLFLSYNNTKLPW